MNILPLSSRNIKLEGLKTQMVPLQHLISEGRIAVMLIPGLPYTGVCLYIV